MMMNSGYAASNEDRRHPTPVNGILLQYRYLREATRAGYYCSLTADYVGILENGDAKVWFENSTDDELSHALRVLKLLHTLGLPDSLGSLSPEFYAIWKSFCGYPLDLREMLLDRVAYSFSRLVGLAKNPEMGKMFEDFSQDLSSVSCTWGEKRKLLVHTLPDVLTFLGSGMEFLENPGSKNEYQEALTIIRESLPELQELWESYDPTHAALLSLSDFLFGLADGYPRGRTLNANIAYKKIFRSLMRRRITSGDATQIQRLAVDLFDATPESIKHRLEFGERLSNFEAIAMMSGVS